MANTVSLCIRVDSTLKSDSEYLFNELGFTLSAAINAFLKKSLRVGGFPFDVRMEKLSQESLDALIESENLMKDPNVKLYSYEEAIEELNK